MRLNEVHFGTGRPVDGYGPDFFRIAGEIHNGAVAILPGRVAAWGGLEDTETPKAAAGDLDILFVGTGAETAHLPEAFRDALEAEGIAVEAMATPAAARTFNVLLSEGRRVGCLLLPV